MKVGDRHVEVLTESLARTQIVQYAGASGDFNPVHTDELFATQVAGFPSVFAHGMLTMGLTAQALSLWLTGGFVDKFGVRFSRQVWPGDRLIATMEVVDVTSGAAASTVDVRIETVNGAGDVVLSGYANASFG